MLYRSGAETLALTGNLVVSGQITGTGAPLSLSSNNIWTGTNQFTQPVQFSNTVSVPDGGISFTAPGAAATRAALSLVPGTDLQAYDADLQTIAALTKPDGGMMVGDGTNWVLESGATLRTSLGLGTTSAVTFDTLTLAGQLSGTTASLSGQLQLPGATGGGGALLLGTTTELYESPAGTLRTPDNLRVDGSTQLGLDGTDPTTVMGRLWLGGGGDVSLERTGAGQMTLTGDLVVTGGMVFGGTLQTASGGTGRDLSGLAANRLLYTDGVGSFGDSPITSVARGLLDDPDTPTMLTTLGAQPLDQDLTTLGGLAKTKGNLIGGNGTAWVTVPRPLHLLPRPFTNPRPATFQPSLIGSRIGLGAYDGKGTQSGIGPQVESIPHPDLLRHLFDALEG
ncbi:MAG: hypothetical protein JNK37_05250 [Verrucomicrobiales bacterium]|nr:hypothetical protein [Verrucomicrobiales bacterium]